MKKKFEQFLFACTAIVLVIFFGSFNVKGNSKVYTTELNSVTISGGVFGGGEEPLMNGTVIQYQLQGTFKAVMIN